MATHPKKAKSASDGLSPLFGVVIRAIDSGAWKRQDLNRAMSAHMSGVALGIFLGRMEREGWISARKGGWAITTRGAGLLPKVQRLPEMRPLQLPPMPPRRPGSSTAHIPSMAAGIERQWRHPI